MRSAMRSMTASFSLMASMQSWSGTVFAEEVLLLLEEEEVSVVLVVVVPRATDVPCAKGASWSFEYWRWAMELRISRTLR